MATKKTTTRKKAVTKTVKKKTLKKSVSKATKKVVKRSVKKTTVPKIKKTTTKKGVKKATVKKAVARSKPRQKKAVQTGWWGNLKNAFATLYSREPETVWFGAVMLAAMILRFVQPDWYINRQFHPDERWIVGMVSQLTYPEEPAGLQYGTFPMYLLATIKDFVAAIAAFFGPFDTNRFTIWAGRMLSGCFDMGTIVFTFLIGRRLVDGKVGRQIGLLAAAFLAFTVLNIQMARFFVVDVPLGMLVMGTLYWSIGIAQLGRRRDYVMTGIFIGLVMATKTAGFPLVAGIGIAHLIGVMQADPEDRSRRWQELGLAVGVSLITFFIMMPHAFLNWEKFWTNQQEQQRILVTGKADVPYNRQYLNTTPYLYYFKNLIHYTQGKALGITSILTLIAFPIIGLVYAGRQIVAKNWDVLKEKISMETGLIIILSFAWAYLAIIGHSFAKFNRYMIPLTPILSLVAACLFMRIQHRLPDGWKRKSFNAFIALVLGSTILWAMAFMSIYQNQHPWIKASRWIHETMPATVMDKGALRPTRILNEEWGDDLPTYVHNMKTKHFQMNKFSVQEPDNPRKREMIIKMLQNNDLIVMADTRAHAVYRRLPKRYPINTAYYELMFEEKLGFHMAGDFSNYPKLFGHEYPDDEADESFTLYDHPHVYLFRADEKRLSQAEIIQRLDSRIAQVKERVARNDVKVPVAAPQLQTTSQPIVKEVLPTVINKNTNTPKDKTLFLLGKVNGFKAGLMWVLMIEIIGLLALPLCLSLFPRLPDSGVSLAKIVGTLVFSWTTWLLVSMGLIKHLQLTTFFVFLLLGGLSAFWAWKRKEEIKEFFRTKGKLWLTGEIIFLVCFIGYMITKLYNPDINNPFGQGYNGGGEPMGISFFTSVYNSVHFPPYDPWLSGYHINYYYFGQVILGVLAKLSGVPPVWSYQIAISLLFALTFTGVYGLGLALTGKRRWGLLAGLAAAMLGNMHSFFYILEPLNRGINFNDFLNSTARWWRETWMHVGRFEFMWNPTRLIKGTINEMPWFSFLYGDLHAHIIAIPYSLPIIGWGLNLLMPAKPNDSLIPEVSGRNGTERGLTFFVTALTLGSLSAINTWNFPAYALLILGVLLIQALQQKKGKKWPWTALRDAVFGWLRLVIGGLALMFFFHKYFTPQSTSLAFVNPAVRTHLKEFLVFFGFAIFMMTTLWSRHLVTAGLQLVTNLGWKKKSKKAWWKKTLDLLQAFWNTHPIAVYISVSFLIGLAILILFNQVLLAVLSLIVLACVYVLGWRPLSPQMRMAMLLALLGLCIVLGCEIVHIRDFMGVGGDMSRMNTVFKFYIIVWIYFALAMVTFAAQLFNGKKEELKIWKRLFGGKLWWRIPALAAGMLVLMGIANFYQENTGVPWLALVLAVGILVVPVVWAIKPGQDEWRLTWTAMLAAIVISVSLYPPITLYNRMRLCSEFKHPTLSGVAYLERMLPKEAKALSWIRQNIKTNAIILEAPGKRGYNCFDTRVAIFTGHPSLIGWVGQEEQMRYNNELTGSRTREADKIYNTRNIEKAKELIEKYQIVYVFVGENEHKAYSLQGLEKFQHFMDNVYDHDGVRIYKKRAD